GALELVLGAEPAGRAAQVGADAAERVEAPVFANDPDAKFLHEPLAHFADVEARRRPGLERRGRLEEHAGEEQRDHREAAGLKGSENAEPAADAENVA